MSQDAGAERIEKNQAHPKDNFLQKRTTHANPGESKNRKSKQFYVKSVL
jgi:hypothetical protein